MPDNPENINFSASVDVGALDQLQNALSRIDATMNKFAEDSANLNRINEQLKRSIDTSANSFRPLTDSLKQINEQSNQTTNSLKRLSDNQIDLEASLSKLRVALKDTNTEFDKLKQLDIIKLKTIKQDLNAVNVTFNATADGTKYFIKYISEAGAQAEVAASKIAKLLGVSATQSEIIPKEKLQLPKQLTEFDETGLKSGLGIESKQAVASIAIPRQLPIKPILDEANTEQVNKFIAKNINQLLKDTLHNYLIGNADVHGFNVLATSGLGKYTNIDFESSFLREGAEISRIFRSNDILKKLVPFDDIKNQLEQFSKGSHLLALPVPKDFIKDIIDNEEKIRNIVAETIGKTKPSAIASFDNRLNQLKGLLGKSQPIFADLLSLNELEDYQHELEVIQNTKGQKLAAAPNIQRAIDKINKTNEELTRQTVGTATNTVEQTNQQILNILKQYKPIVSATNFDPKDIISKVATPTEIFNYPQLVSGAGAGKPPTIPPTITSSPGEPDPDPGDSKALSRAALRAARVKAAIVAAQSALPEFGLTEEKIADLPFTKIDSIRGKLNSLAQSLSTSRDPVNLLSRAFDHLNEGSLKPTTGKISQVIARLSALNSAIQKATQSTTGADFGEAGDVVRKRLLDVPGFTPEKFKELAPEKQAVVLQTIDRLTQLFSQGKITATDFDQAIGRLSGNLEPLQAKAAGVAVALAKIRDIFVEQASQKYAGSVQQDLTKYLEQLGISESVLAKLGTGSAQAARIAINNLAQAMAAGRVSAADLEVATKALKTGGFDALTGGAAVAATQLGNVKSVVENAGQSFTLTIQGISRSLQRLALFRIAGLLINEVRQTATEFLLFEQQIARLSITLDVSESRINSLRNTINTLDTALGKSKPDLAAGALQIYGSYAIEASRQTEVFQDSLKLASATFSTSEVAAKTLSEALGVYKLSAADSNRVTGLLFAATKDSRSSLEDVNRVIDQTALAAKQLNIPLEQVLAVFVRLREQNLSTQQAVSATNQIFNLLVRSGPGLSEIFGKSGRFSTVGEAVKVLGLEQVLKRISEETKTGTNRAQEFTNAIGGIDFNAQNLSGTINKLINDAKGLDNASKAGANTVDAQIKKSSQYLKDTFGLVTNSAIVGFAKILESAVGVYEAISGKSNTVFTNIKTAAQEAADAQTKLFEQSRNSVIVAYDDLISRVKERAFDYLANLKSHFLNTTDNIKEQFKNIEDLSKHILNEVNQQIKANQKEIISFSSSVAKSGFERTLTLLPPQLQAQEIQGRVSELARTNRELFAIGSKAAVDQAKANAKEIDALLSKNQGNIDKAAGDASKIANAYNRAFQSSTREAERLLAGEGRIIDLERARARGAPRSQITALQNQAREGRVTEQDFKRAQDLINLETQRTRNYQVQAPFIAQDRLQQLERLRYAAEFSRQLLLHNQLLEKVGETSQKIPENINKTKIEGEKNINVLNEQRKELQRIADFYNNIPNVALDKLKIAGQQSKGTFLITPDDAATRVNRLLRDVKGSIEGFSATPNQANFDIIKEQASKFNQELLSQNPKAQKSVDDLNQAIELLGQSLTKVPESAKNISEIDKRIETIKEGIPQIQKLLLEGLDGGANNSKRLSDNIQNFSTSLGNSLGVLRDVEAAINRIADASNRIKPISTNDLNALPNMSNINFPNMPNFPNFKPPEPLIPQFAAGGLINEGPIGRDQILARVTKGEFIVNPESTRQFYAQLRAINSGIMPKFGDGGLVNNNTTNVGDINLNLTSNNNQENVRQLANMIQREIRRGNIKFN